MGVQDTIRLNDNIRSLLAKTVAAGEVDLSASQSLSSHLSLEGFIDGVTPA
jgi:hypothetical protein